MYNAVIVCSFVVADIKALISTDEKFDSGVPSFMMCDFY
jgi:hypothetical protein